MKALHYRLLLPLTQTALLAAATSTCRSHTALSLVNTLNTCRANYTTTPHLNFSATPATTTMSNTTENQPQSTPPAAQGLPPISLAQAVQHRHSVYALTNKAPVPDSQVVQIAKDLVRYVPSSFNSQTTRIVLLFGQDHLKFWEMAYEEHVAGAGDDEGKKSRTKGRVDMFKEGSGTVSLPTILAS